MVDATMNQPEGAKAFEVKNLKAKAQDLEVK